MAETKKALYKRYNGTDWDTIAFATLASQITNDSTSKWLMTASNTVNGKAFSKDGGVTITAADIKYGGTTLTSDYGAYVSTILETLASLISTNRTSISGIDTRLQAIETAYGSSGDIITTSNMGTKITKVGTISSGTWQGSKIADSYIASAGTWNAKQDKLTFDSAPTSGSSNPVTSNGILTAINNAKSEVTAIAQGKTKTYVISVSSTVNSTFNQNKSTGSDVVYLAVGGKLTLIDNTTVNLNDLKVGDVILTTTSNISDWFVASIDDERGAECCKIEADTPDLSGYATQTFVNSKFSNYGFGTAAKSNVSTAGVSNNSTNLTTEAQVKSFVEGKGYITGYTNTTYAFDTGDSNGQIKVKPSGGTAYNVSVKGLAAAAYRPVDTSVSAGSSSANVPTSAAVASMVSARATKVFYGGTAPTSMVEGDVWIATN